MQQYDDIKSRNTFTIMRRFGSKSFTMFFVAISKWVMYLGPTCKIKIVRLGFMYLS
jgi:hypothetical protein